MRAAIIPADSTSPVRIEDIKPGYKELQSLVGGSVQVVGIRKLGAWMYLDEDGKMKPGTEFNPRATKLSVGCIHPHDFIVGDVVLMGPPNNQGEDTDLPDDAVAALEAEFGVSAA